MHNKLKTKLNNLENRFPDLTNLVHINQCNTDKKQLEKKIGYINKERPGVSCLVTANIYKNWRTENKIPNTSGLVTTTVLNTRIGEAENKIPDDSGLVKKRDYNAKRSEIEARYFATSDKIY